MTSKKKNKSISIRQYKNRRELNIGIILFAIVFLYLIITVISYLTGEKISVYEVREGSIVKDNSFSGLIIREETAVTSEADGYVSYYQNGNSKVRAGDYIYAISQKKLDTDMQTSSADESGTGQINSEIQSGIVLQIQKFNENYRPEDFSSVYTLKNEIATSLQNALRETKNEHMGAVIAASGQEVVSYNTPRDGIIALTVDGYETLTKDTFTEENFDKSKYESTALEDQMKIQTGDPVYRLITSEDWSVIIPLTEEMAAEMTEDEVRSVRVRIDKDSETLWADFSIIQKDGNYYGCLDFDNSMIRYAEERYLNVELILEDESGLKIPKSSVVEEDFYVIPESYITKGGNSSSSGVLIQEGNGNAVFQALDIFYISEAEEGKEDGQVYVSREDLETGTVLVKPESTDTYTVSQKKPLKGVYNINRGYAVFKKVTILCESDEYYIVQDGEAYGLSNYDHIIQDAEHMEKDEVVFQ